jgi:hypothetical protein
MPTDPKELAQLQRVEIMRMRHRAVPADSKDKPGSVGVNQRLHMKVSCRGDPEGEKVTLQNQKIFSTPSRLTVHSLVLERGHWKGHWICSLIILTFGPPGYVRGCGIPGL